MTTPVPIAELKRQAENAFSAGDLHAARDLLRKICSAAPDDFEAWQHMGHACEHLALFEDALLAWNGALRVKKTSAMALYGLAQAQLQLGDFQGCIITCRNSLAHDASRVGIRTLFARAALALGQSEDAVECLRQALVLKADSAPLHHELGKALLAQQKAEQAMDCFHQAIKIDATNIQYFLDRGLCFLGQGDLIAAARDFSICTEMQPNYVPALINLGMIALAEDRLQDAMIYYKKALTADPASTETLCNIGHLLLLMHDYEGALAHYRQAARIAPDDPIAAAGEASALERQGDKEAALHRLEPFLETENTHSRIACAFATASSAKKQERNAAALMERVLQKQFLTRDEQTNLHFELGRLYDRFGEYDKAFRHYAQGNAAVPRCFDRDRHSSAIDEMISTFSVDFFAQTKPASNTDEMPIFIVGMSRSGTSLIEQILDSHPNVHGAGELEKIKKIAARLAQQGGSMGTLPQYLTRIRRGEIDQQAMTHLTWLHAVAPGARFVTDKMPSNYMFLGLIALLFPKARVIHCRRNPMDSCLSCYFHQFARGHDYSYDLGNLGHYYREYERLMRHWRETLPLRMIDIQYEQLIEKFEPVTRGLLDFLGLDWNPACLAFHRNPRLVSTASYDQVRQPLYSRSAGRWRNYEQHLKPLGKALKQE